MNSMEDQVEQYLHDIVFTKQINHDVNHTVYVPSKGRPDVSFTTKQLEECGINYFIVVEPQDYCLYIDSYGKDKILLMPENDQGIGYVRNWIKNYSQSQGETHHHQIDDDIKRFLVMPFSNTKKHVVNIKSCLSVIEKIENKFSNIAQTGVNLVPFAFSTRKHVNINRLAYSCVLINNSVPYRWETGMIEDIDYTIQVLENGWCTLIFNRILIDLVPTMILPGGNTENLYAGDKRRKNYEKFIEKWPGKFRIKNHPLESKQSCSLVQIGRVYDKYRQLPILKENENV